MTEATTTETEKAGATARESAKYHIFAKDGNYHVVDGKRDAAKLIGDLKVENVAVAIKGHAVSLTHTQVVSIE